MNVNSRPKRKILNETFKRFQRLPDWSLVSREITKRRAPQNAKGAVQFVVRPIGSVPDPAASQSQTLAE
jgi:hypothetical protein